MSAQPNAQLAAFDPFLTWGPVAIRGGKTAA